jgi:glyoxylase-like metal-dependent hydrolase (beta-lactamase superfamily II)
MINRRDFLLTSGVTALAASIPSGLAARAPMATTQAPGYYRFGIGQFQVTMVSDGRFTLPPEGVFPKAPADERNAMLSADFQAPDKLIVQTNALMVNTGDKLVLIDVGSRGKFRPPNTGFLLDNLRAAGVMPEDVDVVVITHGHGDHLWGVTSADGQITFPNAEHVFSETEWNFWMQPNHPLASGGWARTYNENMKAVAPIKDRVRTVKADQEVVTGIQAIALPGHTPGQIGLQITSGQETLIVTADAVLNRTISFDHPEWEFAYDLDPQQGVTTRRSLLDRAATDRTLLSTFHLPFPGIGHVTRSGASYRWMPDDTHWQLSVRT